MNMIDPLGLSLAELSARAAAAAPAEQAQHWQQLREAILLCLQDGRDAEVLAFCADCPLDDVRWMAACRQAPWQSDQAQWLRLVEVLLPRGVLPAIERHDLHNVPSWVLVQFRPLLEGYLQSCPAPGDLTLSLLRLWEDLGFLQHKPPVGHWLPWRAYLTRYPQLAERPKANEFWLLELRWSLASAERRLWLVRDFASLLDRCPRGENEEARGYLEQMLASDADSVASALEWGAFSPRFAYLIIQQGYPQLLPFLLGASANATARRKVQGSDIDWYKHVIGQLLSSRPDDVARLSATQLITLLPYFDVAALQASCTHLTEITSASSAKNLRSAWAGVAAQVPLDFITQAGWLDKRNKNLLLTAIEVLLVHPDPAAVELLQQLDSSRLDATTASRIDGHLQKLGLHDVRLPQDLDLELLEQQAASQKQFSTAIRHYDGEDVLALMKPLSEQAARTLLHLAATSEDEMPPLAAQLLAKIPPLRRGRLARELAKIWIGNEGEPRQRWVLRLLEGNADDQLVDLLADTVVAWHSKRKPRAIIAVGYLARVDTPYALLRVQSIADNPRLKTQVASEAHNALQDAATRRGLSLLELQDELTPDFGLAEGIVLSVGEQPYRIELQGDLSLQVIDDKGKARKSITKPKDVELLDRWEDAAGQLKTLNAALKRVIQQQGPRMEGALMTGQCWDLARWQRLFLQHPLLRVVGRSLIWCDQSGQSFRIAEDFSLVNVEDDPVELADSSQIHLWHPVSAAEGELEAWQQYFTDYEMVPLLDQIGAPAGLPTPEQLEGHMLAAAPGLKVEQMRLTSLLRQFGYRTGPVVDGPSIRSHVWQLDALELVIELRHGGIPPWRKVGNHVEIKGLRVHGMALASLPPALLATLQHQLNTLQQYAEVASA